MALHVSKYTDQEFETLPHIILTSELEWDPSVLDHKFKEDEQWGDFPSIPSSLDEVGDYKQQVILKHQSYFERQDGDSNNDIINRCIFATHTTSVYGYDNTIFFDAYETEILDTPVSLQDIVPKTTVKREPDFQRLPPLFGWMSTDITQYARLPT
jgi:hypothetical protein